MPVASVHVSWTEHCRSLVSYAVWCSHLGVNLACRFGSGNPQRFPLRTAGRETPCDCGERRRHRGRGSG